MTMTMSTDTMFAPSVMPSTKSEAGASIVARYQFPGFAQPSDNTLNGRLTALMTTYSAGILSGKDYRVARRTLIQRQMLANRGMN